MKIIIRENESSKRIKINLPMCFITTIIRFVKISDDNKILKNMNIENDKNNQVDKKVIIKAMKYLRKNHKGLVLVEVSSPSGEYVKIQV